MYFTLWVCFTCSEEIWKLLSERRCVLFYFHCILFFFVFHGYLRQITNLLWAIIHLYSLEDYSHWSVVLLKLTFVFLCAPAGVPTVPLLPPQVSQSLTSVPPVNPATTLPGEWVTWLEAFLKQKLKKGKGRSLPLFLGGLVGLQLHTT